MKLTCDLCGGELQMNASGQGATCTGCGMNYPLDSLRQKLNSQPQTDASVSAHTQTEAAGSQSSVRELIVSRKFDLQAMLFNVIVIIDGEECAILSGKGGEISIPISQGDHEVYAIVQRDNKVTATLDSSTIHVGNHNWLGHFYVRRTAWNAYWQFDLGEDINDVTRT